MAEIHKLLQEHGKTGVLALDVDRRVVEAATGYLCSEEGEVGVLYSGWAQSALPHKKLADDMSWQVHTDHVVSLPAEPEAVGFQRRKASASMNGCVTGTPPPKLSVDGDRAFDLADNVSDAFWSNLGPVLHITRNFP